MRQTLFYIPHSVVVAGLEIPVFGWGLVIVLWALFCAVLLGVQYRKYGWGREVTGLLPVLAVVAAAILFVLPGLEFSTANGTPIGLPIRGYGVFLLAGVIAGVWLAAWRARRMGLDPELIFSLAFWMFLAGIVGARAFYVIQKWPKFRNDDLGQLIVNVINPTQGGLVVYGSVIGGLAAAWFFLRRHRLPALAIADLIAPGMVLGLALGRIGCLMNGCCFGGMCDVPWAISFPAISSPHQEEPSPPYAYQHQIGWLYGIRVEGDAEGWPYVTVVVQGSVAAEALGVEPDAQGRLAEPLRIEAVRGQDIQQTWEALPPGERKDMRPIDVAQMLIAKPGGQLMLKTADRPAVAWSIGELPAYSRPVHPTQVYSSINAFLLCLLLLAVYPYRRRDGEVLVLMVVLYGITRFLLEIIRTDEGAIFGTGLTISQNVSLLLIAAAILGWLLYVRRQPRQSALPPAVSPSGKAVAV